MRQSRLYIEIVGPSGVGKTSLTRALAKELSEYCVSVRGGTKKRRIQNILNTFTSMRRLVNFFQIYFFMHNARGVPRGCALWRAAAMTGISVCYRLVHRKAYAVLVEEGPVSYLASYGQCGGRWQGWVDVLLPAPAEVRPFYVMLTASKEELRRRAIKRGRQPKLCAKLKGANEVSADSQTKAREHCMMQLSERGAHCMIVDTQDQSADAVAQRVLEFISLHNIVKYDEKAKRGTKKYLRQSM